MLCVFLNIDSGGPAPNITTAISGGYSDLDPTDVAIFRPSIDTGGLSPLGNIRTYRGNLVKGLCNQKEYYINIQERL